MSRPSYPPPPILQQGHGKNPTSEQFQAAAQYLGSDTNCSQIHEFLVERGFKLAKKTVYNNLPHLPRKPRGAAARTAPRKKAEPKKREPKAPKVTPAEKMMQAIEDAGGVPLREISVATPAEIDAALKTATVTELRNALIQVAHVVGQKPLASMMLGRDAGELIKALVSAMKDLNIAVVGDDAKLIEGVVINGGANGHDVETPLAKQLRQAREKFAA